MKKALLIFLSFFLFAFSSFSQYYFYNDNYYDNDLLWEAGISLGTMHAATDVGSKSGNRFSPATYDWKSAKLNNSMYFGLIYKNVVGLRLELTKGAVAGDDSRSNSSWIKTRNANFKSHIYEAALISSVHPLMLANEEIIPYVSPYLMFGLAYFNFYPEGYYGRKWVNLHRLSTEGEGFKEYPDRKIYNLNQWAIPFGFGFKYEQSPRINVRMEVLYRHTFTDYLDDVSKTYIDPTLFNRYFSPEQAALAASIAHSYTIHDPSLNNTGEPRGTAHTNDGYFTINLKVGLVFGRQKIR